ncbi:MAG: hypothetical protein EBY44_10970 [Actinobacteria bacterium]|nr:hypothetical protein [Actinomycetota bacterium]
MVHGAVRHAGGIADIGDANSLFSLLLESRNSRGHYGVDLVERALLGRAQTWATVGEEMVAI